MGWIINLPCQYVPMAKIGFLLNPIAGMGGSVGLKGTDGMVGEALRRGARPQAQVRAREFLSALASFDAPGLEWMTCGDPMGFSVVAPFFDTVLRVYDPPSQTSRDDTIAAARAMIENGCELIVFCGGDGTARDIYGAIGGTVPVLGIPGGVKMYSGVFAITPAAGATLLGAYLRGEAQIGEAEIVDINEDAYRRDRISTSLYGIAKTLYEPVLVPSSKEAVVGPDEDVCKEDIARTVVEMMDDKTCYIIGAGSTAAHIESSVGLDPTLLGIDVVRGGKLVVRDADESALHAILDDCASAKLILSPLGAKGVLIGRGTGPITPSVLGRIGIDNIVAVATPLKLAALPQLLVDTGNKEFDALISKKGYLSVINGYRTSTMKKIGLQNV